MSNVNQDEIAWPVRPDEVEAHIRAAAEARPDAVHVETCRQYVGRDVHAVTVTDAHSHGAKPALLFTQPHAHEPAATVGLLHVLSELVFGRDLNGQPTRLDVQRVMDTWDITLIPDGNPDGRDRATCLWLDGIEIDDNEDLRRQMRGVDQKTGAAWGRYDRWTVDEMDPVPDPVGIVYEQLDERTWCEPNRCEDSTFMKLCHRLLTQRDYLAWVDLHQTQMAGEDANCFVLLPVLQDELPTGRQQANLALAERMHAAWGALPFGRPRVTATPFPYTGEEAAYFHNVWGPIQRRMVQVNVEVQMNSPRTPPAEQAALEAEAVRAVLQSTVEDYARR